MQPQTELQQSEMALASGPERKVPSSWQRRVSFRSLEVEQVATFEAHRDAVVDLDELLFTSCSACEASAHLVVLGEAL